MYISKIRNNKIFDQNTLNKKLKDDASKEYFYSTFLKRKRMLKNYLTKNS
jgi:hypothetical protein